MSLKNMYEWGELVKGPTVPTKMVGSPLPTHTQGQVGLAVVRTTGNCCRFTKNPRTGETALRPGERNIPINSN